jgi:hypothetical protein
VDGGIESPLQEASWNRQRSQQEGEAAPHSCLPPERSHLFCCFPLRCCFQVSVRSAPLGAVSSGSVAAHDTGHEGKSKRAHVPSLTESALPSFVPPVLSRAFVLPCLLRLPQPARAQALRHAELQEGRPAATDTRGHAAFKTDKQTQGESTEDTKRQDTMAHNIFHSAVFPPCEHVAGGWLARAVLGEDRRGPDAIPPAHPATRSQEEERLSTTPPLSGARLVLLSFVLASIPRVAAGAEQSRAEQRPCAPTTGRGVWESGARTIKGCRLDGFNYSQLPWRTRLWSA